MRRFTHLVVVGLLFANVLGKDPNIEEQELEAREFLRALNKKTEENVNRVVVANWAYASNLTEANLKAQVKISK